MPCYDDRPRQDCATATRLACEFCKFLEEQKVPIPSYAQQWWKDHKENDEFLERLRKK